MFIYQTAKTVFWYSSNCMHAWGVWHATSPKYQNPNAMSRRCGAIRCGRWIVRYSATWRCMAGGKYLPAKFDDLLYKKKLHIAIQRDCVVRFVRVAFPNIAKRFRSTLWSMTHQSAVQFRHRGLRLADLNVPPPKDKMKNGNWVKRKCNKWISLWNWEAISGSGILLLTNVLCMSFLFSFKWSTVHFG